MRHATPAGKNKSDSENEKNSGKKLVQARLPFKLLAPGSTPSTETPTTIASEEVSKKNDEVTENRKRKLSYGSDEEGKESAEKPRRSGSKENVEDATTKKPKIEDLADEVVFLDDTSEDECTKPEPVSAVDSPKTPITNSKKTGKKTPKNSKSVEKKASNSGSGQKLQIKLPLSNSKKNKKRKTVKSSMPDVEIVDDVATAESSDDVEMLAGELNPQKRPKHDSSTEKQDEEDVKQLKDKAEESIQEDPESKNGKIEDDKSKTPDKTSLSDDVQVSTEKKVEKICSPAKNPSPKKNSQSKVSDTTEDLPLENAENPEILKSPKSKQRSSIRQKEKQIQEKKTKDLEAEDKTPTPDTLNEEKLKKSAGVDAVETKDLELKNAKSPTRKSVEKTLNSKIQEVGKDVQKKVLEDKSETVEISDNEDGQDRESDSYSSKSETSKPSKKESVPKLNDSTSSKNKNLTPKQQKYLEQRRKAREERERQIAEERRQKQLEKEQKELERKKEREEREEQKRKEREEKEEQRKREKEEKEEQKRKEKEEKDEQRKKEREEKERKRLAEIEAKNEEKRKQLEAKEEEQRKKDDERKRKEQEKEKAEMKKKKAAEAFTKFFVAKPTNSNSAAEFDQTSNDSNSLNESLLAFRPFQIKGDMKMAPIVRKNFSEKAKKNLDKVLGLTMNSDDEDEIVRAKPPGRANLYLAMLKTGKVTPVKWKKPKDVEEKDDDIILIEDELDRAGQEIIEESHPPVERHRAKFYKFHENQRPPYYGTWRKKSEKINPRKPFAQDQKFFDYEVDSDLEWEEEEPGESLDGSDDDKEKESEDDDYEVDNEWFVPHGHLSEEEMQNEDEIGGEDDNTREAQKAKLQLLQQEFAQEMKKKTEKIKPRLVGCVWVDENGNQPDLCPKIIWDKLESIAMLCTEPPLIEEPPNPEKCEPSSPSSNSNGALGEKTAEKLKPLVINDDLQKVLVRLIHGNTNSKVFLIKEFIAYVEANEDSIKNGDVRGPLKSAVKEKFDEFAEWKVKEFSEQVKNKKNKLKKFLCWVVREEVLKNMDMTDLDLKNDWQYILTPKRKETSSEAHNDCNNEQLETTTTVDPESLETKTVPKSTDVEDTKHNVTSKSKAKKQQSPKQISSLSTKKQNAKTQSSESEPPPKKKRVALLMSVARGQQFATPKKNALISQFLKKSSEEREKKSKNPNDSKALETDNNVIILD